MVDAYAKRGYVVIGTSFIDSGHTSLRAPPSPAVDSTRWIRRSMMVCGQAGVSRTMILNSERSAKWRCTPPMRRSLTECPVRRASGGCSTEKVVKPLNDWRGRRSCRDPKPATGSAASRVEPPAASAHRQADRAIRRPLGVDGLNRSRGRRTGEAYP